VRDSKLIARRYILSKMFFTDVGSFLGQFKALKMFSILKMVRVFRLSGFI